jgi:hypothetical protein
MQFAFAPLMGCEIFDASFHDAQAFAFEELPLQGNVRLAQQQTAAGPYDAMPRDSATARAGSHGASGGTRAAVQPQCPRDAAVSCDAPAWDCFHQFVYRIPIHRIHLIDAAL